MISRSQRGAALRAGMTLAAQSLSSVTNFAVAALAQASGNLAAFGRFSIAFQLCQAVIAVGYGSIGEMVLVHTSAADRDDKTTRLREGAATASLLFGGAMGLGLIVGGLLFPESRTLLILAGFGSAALVAQYTYRAQLFAQHRAAMVVLVDSTWLAVVLMAVGAERFGWDASPNGYLAVWLVGAALSGSPVIVTGLTRGVRHVREFIASTGAQLTRLAAESLLARSVFVIPLIAAGLIVDVEASGELAAAVLVFSPLSVVHTAIHTLVVPRQVARRNIHIVSLRVVTFTAALAVGITLAWAGVVVAIDRMDLFGGPFDLEANGVTAALFIATLLRFVGLATWRGPLVGFRVANQAGRSLQARISGSLAQWGLMIVGLYIGGIEGGAWGLAAGTAIGAGEAWRQFARLRGSAVVE